MTPICSKCGEAEMGNNDLGLCGDCFNAVCPSCDHESHAGRCFVVILIEGRYIQCNCKVSW